MTNTNTTSPKAPAPQHEDGVTPEHRAWMNEQIERALQHKRSGKATYKSLDEVRQKFGL